MPKRRAHSDEEDEVSENAAQNASEEEVVKKPKKSTAKSEKAKAQPSEKPRKGKEATTDDGGVKTNEEGEQYVDLGRNRRVTARVFKGMPLIDIREYFGSGNDQKPGKKGISLKLEEWRTLKQNTEAIDEMLSNIKTKD